MNWEMIRRHVCRLYRGTADMSFSRYKHCSGTCPSEIKVEQDLASREHAAQHVLLELLHY